MSAYAVFSAVYQGGLFPGFSKYYIEADEDNKKIVFSNVFTLILGLGFLFSLLGTYFQTDIAAMLLQNPGRRRLIYIAVWMLFADTVFAALMHLLKSKELSGKAAYYTTASAVFNLMLNFFFVFYRQRGVEGILLAQLMSGAIVSAGMFPVIVENYSFKINPRVLKNILRFSFPLLIGGIFSTLVDVADRFLLDRFLNKELVGIYSFSYRIAMVMNIFVIAFSTAWTPYFLRIYKEDKSFSAIFGSTFNKLAAMLLFIFLAVSLFAGNFFDISFSGQFLFNPAYKPGLIIIPCVLTGYALRGLISFYSIYPYVTGKSYHFMLSDLTAFIVNIVANYLLIPKIGILGAGIATALSFAAAFIYLFTVSKGIRINYRLKKLLILISSAMIIFIAGGIYDSLPLKILLVIIYTVIIQRTLKPGTDKSFR